MQKLKNFSSLSIFILFFLGGSLACTRGRPPAQISSTQILQAAKILKTLQASQPHPRILSAFVQVQIQARGRQESFDAAVLAQYPNKLRIEILDDLGQTYYRLVADGRKVLWQDLKKGEYGFDDQGEDSLRKALKLPLSIEEFIARLFLNIPPGKIISLRENQTGKFWELGRERDALEIQRSPLRLKAYQARKKPGRKKNRYRVSYEYPNPGNASSLPQALQWSFKKPKLKLSMHLMDAEWNRSISWEKFQPLPPEGR